MHFQEMKRQIAALQADKVIDGPTYLGMSIQLEYLESCYLLNQQSVTTLSRILDLSAQMVKVVSTLDNIATLLARLLAK